MESIIICQRESTVYLEVASPAWKHVLYITFNHVTLHLKAGLRSLAMQFIIFCQWFYLCWWFSFVNILWEAERREQWTSPWTVYGHYPVVYWLTQFMQLIRSEPWFRPGDFGPGWEVCTWYLLATSRSKVPTGKANHGKKTRRFDAVNRSTISLTSITYLLLHALINAKIRYWIDLRFSK